MATVREAALDILTTHGMTTIFGNPGSTEMGLINDLPAEFRYVMGLQEAAVVSMADGYAQATGRPTLVNLHSGPGVGNAMGSIINARANRSPLVITAGTQIRGLQTMEAFLTNVDATVLPLPAVKWAGEAPRAEDTPAVLARAIHTACLPPSGPVFVSQPADDWGHEVDLAQTRHLATRRVRAASPLSPDALSEIGAALGGARNPVLILGAVADNPDAWASSVRFAEATGVAVMMAPLASRWSFPGWHPQFRGVLLPSVAAAAAQLAPYDLALVVGSPVFRYYPNQPGELLPPGTCLIQITDDPEEAARAPMGDAYVADPGAALEALAGLAEGSGVPARTTAGEPPAPTNAPGATPLSPADVYAALDRVFPDDLAMVHESPSNLNAMFSVWRPRYPESLFFSGSGGLGFGTSATVGVQMGMPDRPVVGILGDGALQYSVQGLYTAAQHEVPATFLVLRNHQYAVLKWFGRLENAPAVPGLDLPGLDAVAIAEGYGVAGETVSDTEALEDALARAASSSTPRLIQVDIDSSSEAM